MVSTVLSVSWKEHSIALTEVCKSLLDNNFLVDCTIAAQGRSLKAHRLILSACSPYFQMLFGEECEKHPIVILQNASFDILKAMIDFMYHGETQVPEERLEAFLALAETLQIKGLNDSSKKDRRKSLSCDAARAARRRRPSNEDIKVSCEVQSTSVSHEGIKVSCDVQSTSVSHEGSPDGSSQQQHSYQSEVYTDVAQSNCTISMKGSNSSYEPVKPAVIQPSQQQVPPLPDEVSSDAVQTMNPESLHHVYLVPKHEQVDDDESDEPTQDMHESDMNRMDEETAPAYDDQHMNHYSNVAQRMENSNVVPGTFTMPQMAGPPEAQVDAISYLHLPSKRPRRSAVWNYFAEMEGSQGRRVVCRLCGASTTRPGGGTSNMRHHMRSNHPHLAAATEADVRLEPPSTRSAY